MNIPCRAQWNILYIERYYCLFCSNEGSAWLAWAFSPNFFCITTISMGLKRQCGLGAFLSFLNAVFVRIDCGNDPKWPLCHTMKAGSRCHILIVLHSRQVDTEKALNQLSVESVATGVLSTSSCCGNWLVSSTGAHCLVKLALEGPQVPAVCTCSHWKMRFQGIDLQQISWI